MLGAGGLANGDAATTDKDCTDDLWDRYQRIKMWLLEQTRLKGHQGGSGRSRCDLPPGLC